MLPLNAQVCTKELGKTGVRIPALAQGTWKYQGGIEPLRAGIELGASFIDTAESYGTEETVGQAIRGIRDRVFIATKSLPRHFRRPDIIEAAERSLKRLRTEYIDLYQLHWPNYSVPDRRNDVCVGAIGRQRENSIRWTQ
jgi:diketogulonate reductase-like aldo/keto reductase